MQRKKTEPLVSTQRPQRGHRKDGRIANHESQITNWLFRAPLKYTGLTAVLIAVLALIVNFVASPTSTAAPALTAIALVAICVFSIYKILRWTPDEQIDHKSFTMLNIGQALVGVLLVLTLGMLGIRMQNVMSMNASMLMAIVGVLILVFLFGTWMLQLKSIFCRARALGVPKWKLWLSIPFGIWLFWYPGFLAYDAKKNQDAISAKSNWMNNIGNWIVARPRNTALAFLCLVVFHMILMAGDTIGTLSLLLVSLGFMALIMLCKKVRENIGGIFANVIMILNIVLIVGILFAAFSAPKSTPIMQEQIEITEVSQ
jgi:hypothetical protein